MSKPTTEQLLPPKPQARPRLYAYSIADAAHAGLLKVGQTTRDVRQRVAEQLRTAAITNYRIELIEAATRTDGSIITDHELRGGAAALVFRRCGWRMPPSPALSQIRSPQDCRRPHSATISPARPLAR